ncbi:MAG: hypothetical protein J1E16_09495 [Muribaculaceae bacterium]|nr:hypothetical protein [Muribaculaceae bacterium]
MALKGKMKGSQGDCPILCLKRQILLLGIQVERQSGVTFFQNWGYTFRVFRGVGRGGEKYHNFKIDPQKGRFTLKKKPPLFKAPPY